MNAPTKKPGTSSTQSHATHTHTHYHTTTMGFQFQQVELIKIQLTNWTCELVIKNVVVCHLFWYIYIYIYISTPLWRNSPQWAMAYSFTRFLDHTQWRITVSRTPLNEWSARCRDLYLTTHNTHNRHPCPRWDSDPHPSRRAAADLHLRPRSSWDRQHFTVLVIIIDVSGLPMDHNFKDQGSWPLKVGPDRLSR